MSAPRRTSKTPATGVGRTSSFLTPGMVAAAASGLATTDGLGAGPGVGVGTSPAQALTAAARASAGIKRRRGFIGLNYTTRGRSAAGVVARMQVLQPLARHVRVDLRRRQIAVAEQHLHDAQVRAVIEQ